MRFIADLLSFHKPSKYQSESEVRLFFRVDDFFADETDVTTEISNSYELLSYNKIYLKEKSPYGSVPDFEEKRVVRLTPAISIKKIYLGSELSSEQLLRFKDHLLHIGAKNKLNFAIGRVTNEYEIIERIN